MVNGRNGFHSITEIARACGGNVSGGQALVPGPGHSSKDRSLSIKLCAVHQDGFICHSFAGDDPIVCRDYVRSKLRMEIRQPPTNRGRWLEARPAPKSALVEARPVSQSTAPERLAELPRCERPEKFIPDSDGDMPPARMGELRRHVYRRDGEPVRAKIKIGNRDGSARYENWYRVAKDDGVTGWQGCKPTTFRAVPYVGAVMPFTPESVAHEVLWPEGEKDVDTLASLGFPAFTFGGAGDGLPQEAAAYLSGRRVVILADNDDRGRTHAKKKAALAFEAGAASVRVVHFRDLRPKEDVSDFLAAGASFLCAVQQRSSHSRSIGFGSVASRSANRP